LQKTNVSLSVIQNGDLTENIASRRLAFTLFDERVGLAYICAERANSELPLARFTEK